MVLFHFSSFVALVALYSISKPSMTFGFETSSFDKTSHGVKNHMNDRAISALYASRQDERKKVINHITDIQRRGEHENYHRHLQNQQKSPFIRHQSQPTDAEQHHQPQQQRHRHDDQHHDYNPLVVSLHKDKEGAQHFQPSTHHPAKFISPLVQPRFQLHEELSPFQDREVFKEEKSHVLTIEEISPIFQFTNKKGNLKVINLYGLYNLFIILITMPFWMLSMEVLHRLGDSIDGFDDDRSKFDFSGKMWCRTYLRLVDSYPEIAGDVSRLKDKTEGGYGGACLFVANHASFLDIAVLCTVLDSVFKFIAKDSLAKFPGVGKQLVGGEHILIDRNDKRSQLRSFKQAINYLQNGIPIMAFPEGARSPDGRLMAFKPGLFSMAVKANVPIVPLSIANTHAVMPSVGLLSVQRGKGKLRVYVHDPIEVDGKSEEEISNEVRKALLSELPRDQHPLEDVVVG